MAAAAPQRVTWQTLSRIAGLVIIFALLVAYLVAEMTGNHLENPIALAFLAIGSGLIGIPDGVTVVRRGGDIHIGPKQRNGDAA